MLGVVVLASAAALGWAALSGADRRPATSVADASVSRADGESPVGYAGTPHEGGIIYLRRPGASQSRTCTLGPVLGDRTAITAGHCGNVGDLVSLHRGADAVGSVSAHQGSDLATISFYPDVSLGPVSTLPNTALRAGEPIAKRGAATGRTTGTLAESQPHRYQLATADGRNLTVAGVSAHLCAAAGDSGAPVYRQSTSEIIGIVIAVDHSASQCSAIISPFTDR